MLSGWSYRIVSLLGVVTLVAVASLVAQHQLIVSVISLIPIIGGLPAQTTTGTELFFEAATTGVVLIFALAPLFKPRPRRILDTITLTQKRVLIAIIALAAIGYFDYTYRLPRRTLIVMGTLLLIAIPAWFVLIRSRPTGTSRRAIIVGDDPDAMKSILDESNLPIIGYVSPPSAFRGATRPVETPSLPDGGYRSEFELSNLECLGGLSRLDDILVEYDVDTAILAFSRPDRSEFFGTLDTCYEHGVTAKVHRDHADVVLTTDVEMGNLIDIDLDPWDWQDYALKRAFDIAFAFVGLVLATPISTIIALSIKLDDGGPIFYRQRRSATFGETFTVAKFRSMTTDAEDVDPIDDEDNAHITRIGHLLRRTHLDEIPQLWSVLIGDMSVVGPRATWVGEERLLEEQQSTWRRRWFVKPGLTGLAQINGISSTNPEEKLRYDIMYIRNQTFGLDLKIVIRQFWIVIIDTLHVLLSDSRFWE